MNAKICFLVFCLSQVVLSESDLETRTVTKEKLEALRESILQAKYAIDAYESTAHSVVDNMRDDRRKHANGFLQKSFYEINQIAKHYDTKARLMRADSNITECIENRRVELIRQFARDNVKIFYSPFTDVAAKFIKKELDGYFEWYGGYWTHFSRWSDKYNQLMADVEAGVNDDELAADFAKLKKEASELVDYTYGVRTWMNNGHKYITQVFVDFVQKIRSHSIKFVDSTVDSFNYCFCKNIPC